MGTNLDAPFVWTQFFSPAALKKVEHRESLNALAKRFEKHVRASKAKLHWFAGRRFGDQKSEKGSYRTNANVLAVTAIEADYDGGKVSPEEAARILTEAHLLSLVYTTPSHTDEKPRWRVIAPLGDEQKPDERARLVARLNGVLGGILAPESFTLSLSYYFGRPADKPPIRTFLIDGDFLDLRYDLDAGAIGKHADDDGAAPTTAEKVDLEWDDFAAAVRAIPNDGTDSRFDTRSGWIEVLAAIHHQSDGDEDGRALAHEWSRQHDSYDADYTDTTWDTLGKTHGRVKTGAFIIMLAAERGWRMPHKPVDPEEAFADVEAEGEIDEDYEELVNGKSNKKKKKAKPTTNLDEETLLEKMNRRHALVLIGNKTLVLMDHGKGRVTFHNRTDIDLLYENNRIATTNSSEPLSRWWYRQPGRRTYLGGVVFAPGNDAPADAYNLWKGFSVEPNPEGSCKLYLDHLFENVCQGKEEDYRYLIGWMAHMVQYPGEKPGVAVVLKGDKGVGKDVVAVHLGRLFERNYVKINEMEHLTGKFNAHMENALLLHVEEGLWAGDKRAESSLKSLITSSMIALERKGVDVVTLPNVSRAFITSNEEWVVPATRGERRYAVYLVGTAHMQDRPYFRAIEEQLKQGGYGALLHFLQTYDLTGFDVGVPPNTTGLADQKMRGLKGPEAFWLEILLEGQFPVKDISERFDGSKRRDWSTEGQEVLVDPLYDAWKTWWEDRRGFGHGPLLDKISFGRVLTRMCPTKIAKQRGPRNDRHTTHIFPTLADCRKQFDSYIGSGISWPEDYDEDVELI